jgi:glutathione synthase/RimK-type ligase-like ATP-grasp enzyme
MRKLVIVGIEDERVELFRNACRRADWPEPTVISYHVALRGLGDYLDSNSGVRFESTDENLDALRCYLSAGAELDDPEEPNSERIDLAQAIGYEAEPGAIRYMRQMHLGRVHVWQRIEREAALLGAHTMNSARALAITFDKRETSACLLANNVAVSTSFPGMRNFADIASIIDRVPGRQVMVKTAHGAGAAGIVALRTDGRRWHASTTAVLRDGLLWNTRRVHTLVDRPSIQALVDAVCREVVHVEQWLPKATTNDGSFDLRVVVIGGVAGHVLMRSARGPFTNLHLGAKRGDVDALRERVGPQVWNCLLQTAERAVRAIDGLLYAGVDLLLQSDWSTVVVLEVNGFGDWHPDVFVDGMDTYDWELRALQSRTELEITT